MAWPGPIVNIESHTNLPDVDLFSSLKALDKVIKKVPGSVICRDCRQYAGGRWQAQQNDWTRAECGWTDGHESIQCRAAHMVHNRYIIQT